MWIALTVAAVIALAVAALHIYRWPIYNAATRAQRAKAGLKENVVRVDGHDITYLEGGNGEPLLLLHGFGANKDHWAMVAPMLAPHFRLVIPDLPGFGESTRDPQASYDADSQIERIEGFVTALELGPLHIGGNSMGGYLAGLYTARYPHAVKSQWLLAPAGVASAEASELIQFLERGENPLLVEDVDDFHRLMDMCFTKAPYVPKAFQRCLFERNRDEREFNDKIFGDMFAEPKALEDALAGAAVKTQIVWGDGDRILHPSGAHALGQVLGQVETVVMQRMGHCPMLERPRETADRYLGFQGVGARA